MLFIVKNKRFLSSIDILRQIFLESLFFMLDTAIGEQLTTQHKEAWTAYSTMLIRAYKKGRGDSLTGIFETDPVPFTKKVKFCNNSYILFKSLIIKELI